MFDLFLKKEGILEYRHRLENNEYELLEIAPSSKDLVLGHLSNTIKLSDDFTVRDFFKLIKRYPILQKIDFWTESFVSEYESCKNENCIDPDGEVYQIIFQKVIEFTKYSKDEPIECNIFIDILGKGKDSTYSLSFWKLENFLDLPVKLYPIKSYTDDYTEKPHSKSSNIKEFNIVYTLFEFITSFIYELSFYGTPEDRDKKGDELKENVEKIKSGEMKTYPYEDLFKEEEKEE